MLTKDDLRQIKGIIKPLEQKIDGVAADVSELKLDVADLKTDVADIKLETKGIHVILERQERDLGGRIDRLEEQAGINN